MKLISSKHKIEIEQSAAGVNDYLSVSEIAALKVNIARVEAELAALKALVGKICAELGIRS